MEIRFTNSPKETWQMNTQQLRESFLIRDLMLNDKINLIYSHYDRMIIGGAKPVSKKLQLEVYPELRADYFLERRELGIINVGDEGKIEADGKNFSDRKSVV